MCRIIYKQHYSNPVICKLLTGVKILFVCIDFYLCRRDGLEVVTIGCKVICGTAVTVASTTNQLHIICIVSF